MSRSSADPAQQDLIIALKKIQSTISEATLIQNNNVILPRMGLFSTKPLNVSQVKTKLLKALEQAIKAIAAAKDTKQIQTAMQTLAILNQELPFTSAAITKLTDSFATRSQHPHK